MVYLLRCAVALLVVAPAMFFLVPLLDIWIYEADLSGEYRVMDYFLGMLGFYGGYVLLVVPVGSIVHTRLVRRRSAVGSIKEIVLGVIVGVVVLIPQALVFGFDYWLPNLAVGIIAGGFYGLLVLGIARITKRVRSGRW